MSVRGILIFFVLLFGAPMMHFSASTNWLEGLKLLGTGDFYRAEIVECDYFLQSRGNLRNGRRTGRSMRMYFPVAKTIHGDITATGSSIFAKPWCEKHIGRKVIVYANANLQKIFTFSQYIAPAIGLVVLVVALLLMGLGRLFKKRFYKAAELLITVSILVGGALSLYEYFLW